MSKINTFLQKRKMHESHNGIMMVAIAYLLSFVMLVVGSDTFYNINSSAAGNAKSNEETQDLLDKDSFISQIVYHKPELLQRNLINPYGLTEDTINDNQADLSGDTNWFLGYAMDEIEYEQLFKQMNDDWFATKKEQYSKDASEETAKATSKKTSKKTSKDTSKDNSEETIETLALEKATDNKYIVSITDKEIGMLEHIVEAEASGEDMTGKILVANVVCNRVLDKNFPDTVEEVIYQKVDGSYQFSPLQDKRFWSVKVSKNTKKAVKRALQGEDYSDGALYFIARKIASKRNTQWFDNNLKWLFKHGGHEFYKNK